MTKRLLVCLTLIPLTQTHAQEIDFGNVTEQHVMVPMRDGKRLSAYLYQPTGKGPWPAVFEQRYARLTGRSTRLASARLAAEGFVVAMVNFRGTHLSEGTWVGYRALQWGELQDGYDTCEWLAKQSFGQSWNVWQFSRRVRSELSGSDSTAASGLPVHDRYGAEFVPGRLSRRRDNST